MGLHIFESGRYGQPHLNETLRPINMAIDKTIFGLRFGADDELCPSQDDLRIFLESRKEEKGTELHGEDLKVYNEMLASVKAFGQYDARGAVAEKLQRKMFFGALEHVSFFNPAFKSVIAQYKYHLDALKAIDFKKPKGFIKSAEEELRRLNPKKKDETTRRTRLQVMVEERKNTLEVLERRWVALAKELNNIARYVMESLVKIEKLSGTSVSILADPQMALNEESRIIDEIKAQFKEVLKDFLHRHQVAKQDLEDAKRVVGTLSGEISEFVRDDLKALTGLYKSIYSHARKSVQAINKLTMKTEDNEDKSLEDYRKLFVQIEGVLVSVVSEYSFEIKIKESHSETAYRDILDEKRKEMIDRVLELLFKERRLWDDRRYVAERRKTRDPGYKGPERRNGQDRRAGKRRDGGLGCMSRLHISEPFRPLSWR